MMLLAAIGFWLAIGTPVAGLYCLVIHGQQRAQSPFPTPVGDSHISTDPTSPQSGRKRITTATARASFNTDEKETP